MSARKVSDRTAKFRLLALADLLETEVVAKHFNFSTWGESSLGAETGVDLLADPVACGTTACALGWAPALPFAKRMGIRLVAVQNCGTSKFTRNGREVGVDRVARILFGLTPSQVNMLFTPDAQPDGLRDLTGRSTPAEVAQNIRDFVAIRFG